MPNKSSDSFIFDEMRRKLEIQTEWLEHVVTWHLHMQSKGSSHLNLIGNAWRLGNGGQPLELIDGGFRDSCNLSDVLRCVHVSLLCLQQLPEDRPTMSSVLQMLCSESTLPQPKEPGFFSEKDLVEGKFPLLSNETSSNGLTITLLEAH
ncbi:hypothetical protein M0R45_002841 [Rubus argutus]|uniref:S-locus receptor kinase C-terminal domain-containing protein n=1 Tax=Rubus argutus TaxID=59490 RepID=A0AAW1VPF5_RUBAR